MGALVIPCPKCGMLLAIKLHSRLGLVAGLRLRSASGGRARWACVRGSIDGNGSCVASGGQVGLTGAGKPDPDCCGRELPIIRKELREALGTESRDLGADSG